MRVYRTINLGIDYECALYPMKSPTLKPSLVNADGKEVTKTQLSKSVKAQNKFEVDGKEINEAEICYKIGERILKHKPRFTQMIKAYVESERKDFSERIIASEYFVNCPSLLKRLQKSNKMITFPFCWGNGFAFYQAIIYAYGDKHLVMALTYPNVEKGSMLVKMSSALNTTTKEIEDNEVIGDLIQEQGKQLADLTA